MSTIFIASNWNRKCLEEMDSELLSQRVFEDALAANAVRVGLIETRCEKYAHIQYDMFIKCHFNTAIMLLITNIIEN